MNQRSIRLAVVGVGNCASALFQGIEHYARTGNDLGLMHAKLCGYRPQDIKVVAAFDVDARKVGRPFNQAILAKPNCVTPICTDLPPSEVVVQMGPVLDGVAPHMADFPPERTFVVAEAEPVDVVKVLQETGADILVNYLPVGSEEASRHYAECCLKAKVAMVNCLPAFIASDSKWAARFETAHLPLVGDDIKSQVGATIVHRILTRLCEERGARIRRTYQLNTGGNTDFLNMLEHSRLTSKRISKTEAVQSQLKEPLPEEAIHIGPSDYVAWQNDNKVCFLRLEAEGFAGVPFHIEARLSVQDSPNSAGVAIDAIRLCRVALDRGEAGPLMAACAYLMKHPPEQMPDSLARRRLEEYITDSSKVIRAAR